MDPETKSAQTATAGDPANTIFGKILRGEIKSDFIYEDDKCVAFHDVNKQAPVHILIIPKTPISQISTASDEHKEILGHLLLVAKKLAETETDGNGFRLVINDGKNGGQSVYYIHVHLLANRQMTWPPG
ncbi:triad nucleotide-binding 1 [Octopus vulgaris]|uniref:Triad nucleotide-binding 1 n=2 Tax=Octopus TaxID=6643 RepID=A0AA36BGS2_OCTVU|nr:uncharacterized HIT-like protein Synpcc7942_1390 [Octopus sinensis]CAI9733097.1 triad nucleotide-binding 1 [Octopus vulgaris]